MPWLSRNNSPSISPSINGGTVHAPANTTHVPTTIPASITVIPSIIDPTCGTSPSQYRHSAMENLRSSLRVLMRNLYCIPRMIGALLTANMARSMFRCSMREFAELCVHTMLCTIECWAMILVIPAFLTVPGAVLTAGCMAVWGCIMAMCWCLLGNERVCESTTPPGAEDFAEEKFMFVNGAATSHLQMHQHLDRLSAIFQRRIIGMHNRTLGLPLDILLHLLCVMLPIHRVVYSELREALLSPSTRKIVLLSHSTGSKIVSDVLDQLHADLPQTLMAKLEIYTFGAAGGSFSNPLSNSMFLDHGFGENVNAANNGKLSCNRVIPHIEHYLPLTSSPLSTISILHPVLHTLDSRFCGRMFILNGYSPVLFNQYLDIMFTYRMVKDNSNEVSVQEHSFWNERINVDGETAEKREFTAGARGAVGRGNGGERRWSGLLREEREGKKKGWKLGMEGVGMVRREAKALEGKRMREVGRLGGYEGGGRLASEWVEGKGSGVETGIMNGIGMM